MPHELDLGSEALFPRVRINDLVIFEGVYETWLKREGFLKKLKGYGGASESVWRDIFDRLARGLGCASGTELMGRSRKEGDRSPASVLHQRIKPILADLKKLQADAKGRSKRVVIEGSEFGISWLLARVLARSGWLENHPQNELEINQGGWRHYLERLERGDVDLCLGTKCDHSTVLQSERVLTLSRWLIYPKKGAFQPSPEGLESLDMLRHATVFTLAGDVSPSLAKVYEYLPDPEPPGRRIHVQSVALMYQYAGQGLGVAIGYAPYFGMSDAKHSLLGAARIRDKRVEPAEITLYRRAKVELSKAAESLRQAIHDVSAEIEKKQTL